MRARNGFPSGPRSKVMRSTEVGAPRRRGGGLRDRGGSPVPVTGERSRAPGADARNAAGAARAALPARGEPWRFSSQVDRSSHQMSRVDLTHLTCVWTRASQPHRPNHRPYVDLQRPLAGERELAGHREVQRFPQSLQPDPLLAAGWRPRVPGAVALPPALWQATRAAQPR